MGGTKMPKFVGILEDIERELKTENRAVYEYGNLSPSQLSMIRDFYSGSRVSVWGPCQDGSDSKGNQKYRIAIPKPVYQEVKNA